MGVGCIIRARNVPSKATYYHKDRHRKAMRITTPVYALEFP